jgi:hypothetical protein
MLAATRDAIVVVVGILLALLSFPDRPAAKMLVVHRGDAGLIEHVIPRAAASFAVDLKCIDPYLLLQADRASQDGAAGLAKGDIDGRGDDPLMLLGLVWHGCDSLQSSKR